MASPRGHDNNGRATSPNQQQQQQQPSSDSSNICPICRGPIANLSTTNCNHRFCRTCIRRWTSRNATCPSCRQTITEIRNTMPNGMVEVMQISRAEQLANRVNETHSTLMLLFTVLSHTLLPEVSNYLDQLNEIASDLNVPTTLSRLREAVVAAVSRGQTSQANGPSSESSGAQLMRSNSPSSSLITMRSRSGSAASSSDGGPPATTGPGTIGVRMNLSAGPVNASSGAGGGQLSRTALLISHMPASPGRDQPGTNNLLQGGGRSNSSSGPSLGRVVATMGSASGSAARGRGRRGRRRNSRSSFSRSPSPSSEPADGPQRNLGGRPGIGGRTSPGPAGLPAARGSDAAGRQQPQPQPHQQPPPQQGQQQPQPQRPGTPAPNVRPPTPDEVRRAVEQRQQDVRHLSESFNKVNQMYEVLMIMHMVVHRNQVELEPAQGADAQNSSDSSD